ncbi:hypothetical protein GCM10011512_29210 [Tersicoccus solisilvae]|uniref:Barstar (barnase inhibitor) domain-containing protein n=1 Tax=Tersicoccus solisilvae TaxID=1882339 RepID=A0ABQ1PPI2_9MICC|nr:barstar family protein [Tersicoccus solisilvae]GGD00498.1 hypothetical protein GCM10011512_29210 [Tersicoccus solisilvae]
MEELTRAAWRGHALRREIDAHDAAGAGRATAQRPRPDALPVRQIASGPTRETALAAFARELRFPPHTGRNLDALADALRETARDPFALVWHVDPSLPARDADRIAEVLGFVEEEATSRAGRTHEPTVAHHPGNDDRAATGASTRSRPRFRVVVVRP